MKTKAKIPAARGALLDGLLPPAWAPAQATGKVTGKVTGKDCSRRSDIPADRAGIRAVRNAGGRH